MTQPREISATVAERVLWLLLRDMQKSVSIRSSRLNDDFNGCKIVITRDGDYSTFTARGYDD